MAWQPGSNIMIEWNKKDKEKSSFINFEIVDFYPSISKDLLTNYIYFVTTVTTTEKKSLTPSCIQGNHFINLIIMQSGSKEVIQILKLQWEAWMEQRFVTYLAGICWTSWKVNLVERISDCTETVVLAVLKISLDLS